MSRSLTTIIQSIINYIKTVTFNVDTKEGTYTRDVVIDAPAGEFARLFEQNELVSNAQSPATGTDNDIIELAENLQLSRKNAVRATGTVSFFKSSAPTVDITIPFGTTIATLSTAEKKSVSFRTTQSVVMYVSQASSYFDPASSKYEIDANIEAVEAGDDGNIGSRNITVMSTAISGIDGVYNENATSGGADIETIDALKARILARIAGNNIGTIDGYYTLISAADDNVVDVKVVSSRDSEMTRQIAGAVDIYVKGSTVAEATDTYAPTIYPPLDYIVQTQPPITASNATVVNSASGSLTAGVDYEWEEDNSSGYGWSIMGQAKIKWLVDYPGSFIITYQYNSLVNRLQTLINGDSEHIVAADVLIKQAIPSYINVSATITVEAGYDPLTVVEDVELAIGDKLSNYLIGEEIQQADIVEEITDVAGVDDVLLPLSTFEPASGSVGTKDNTTGNISMPSTAYATTGTITVTQST